MKSGIYKITNVFNGKFYIGSAANFNHRWRIHKRQLNENTHHSKKLQNAWNKYGEENFKFEILITCEKEELIAFEQLYIDEEKPEYNILKIAGSSLGYKHRAEDILKMSLAMKGRPSSMKDKTHCEEAKAKMSIAKKGHKYGVNRYYTKETRLKMGIAKTGNKYCLGRNQLDETKAKIAATLTGRTHKQESKDKVSKSLIGNTRALGKKMPVESSIKKSIAMKNHYAIKEILKSWSCAL